jgi:hypothetical protein
MKQIQDNRDFRSTLKIACIARLVVSPTDWKGRAGRWKTEEEEGRGRKMEEEEGMTKFRLDIKDPTQNIVWTVPEGGGGPAYSGM